MHIIFSRWVLPYWFQRFKTSKLQSISCEPRCRISFLPCIAGPGLLQYLINCFCPHPSKISRKFFLNFSIVLLIRKQGPAQVVFWPFLSDGFNHQIIHSSIHSFKSTDRIDFSSLCKFKKISYIDWFVCTGSLNFTNILYIVCIFVSSCTVNVHQCLLVSLYFEQIYDDNDDETEAEIITSQSNTHLPSVSSVRTGPLVGEMRPRQEASAEIARCTTFPCIRYNCTNPNMLTTKTLDL